MRVSDRILANSFLNSINSTKENIRNLQTKILTQKKINAPSDSPSGTSKIIRINDQIQSYETYKNNIENSLSFIQTSVATMDEIQSEVDSLDLLFANLNNPTNDQNLTKVAEQVFQALESIIDLSNTEYDGKYVFGGTDFSAEPFGFNAAGDAVEIKVNSVAGEQNVKISKNINQQVNVTGQKIFGDLDGTDIFNTLLRIRDDLNNGQIPSDSDHQAVKDFSKQMLNITATTGEVINRLNSTTELIDNQLIELKTLLSKENDTDIAEAAIDLQNQQYQLELSYKMSSMILPKSLLDYL